MGLTPWDGGVADPQKHATPPSVTMSNFVAVDQTIWAYVLGPKNSGRWGPALLGRGRG